MWGPRQAPTGRNTPAQGNALGKATPRTLPALKGRYNAASVAGGWWPRVGAAPSGLGHPVDPPPGALPRAGLTVAAHWLGRGMVQWPPAVKKSPLNQAFEGALEANKFKL
jgi:hypothetical protein